MTKERVLSKGSYEKIAYADPKLAPYGLAAQETLQSMKLWDKVQSKMVTGKSIGQTYQFAATGNAEMTFVALSQITKNGKVTEGSWWMAPANMYNPIRQAAVQLTCDLGRIRLRCLCNGCFCQTHCGLARGQVAAYGFGA